MNIATSFKVINGKIQLYNIDNVPISGVGAKWEGDFYCSHNNLTSLEGSPESVGGDFDCSYNNLTSLRYSPESVGGDFDCSSNNLTSLEGSPESVGGNFYCSYSNLTSLRYSPESIGGHFCCSHNNLTSLEGSPESVGGNFDCSSNNLTSLRYSPESVGGNFCCFSNNLTSLEGSPESVGGDFYCSHNNLTSLRYSPESVGGNFCCFSNNLTSLEGSPESVGGDFYCSSNNLTSLRYSPEQNKLQFDNFFRKGFVFLDGILTKKISIKNIDDVIIYKTKKLGYKNQAPIIYVASKNGTNTHGKTVREAVEELRFKTGDRDISQYKDMSIEATKNTDEWAFIYRMITGACKTGTQMFMDSKQLKQKYTLKEILEETKNQFGYDRFKEVTQNDR